MKYSCLRYLLLLVGMITAVLPIYGRTEDHKTQPKRLSPAQNYVYLEYTSSDKWSCTEDINGVGYGATAYGLTTDDIYNNMMTKLSVWPEGFTREQIINTYLDQDGNYSPLYQDPTLDERGKSTLPVNPDELQQYTVTYKDGKPQFSLVTSIDKKIGTISFIPDENLTGPRTFLIKWEVNRDEAIMKFRENKDVAIACLMKSINSDYPDIYIIFKSNPNNITYNKQQLTINQEKYEIALSGANRTYQDSPYGITPQGFDVYSIENIQYVIYNDLLGIDRNIYWEHFGDDAVRDAQQDYQQYEKDATGKWVARDPADYIGLIILSSNMTDDITNLFSKYEWTLTNSDVQKLYDLWDKKTEKTYHLSTTMKFADSKNLFSDVYVVATVDVTFKPYASGIAVNATNFPDEAFRNWVLQNVSGADDGILTDAEIAEVKTISCHIKGILSLQGIEHFTALTQLYCNNNRLTSLDVSKNTALTHLHCNSNKLTSLDVSKNTALTSLDCSNNQLTSLDVSKNTALTNLWCLSNQLTNLDVSKNIALTFLACYSNQLTTLDVSKNTALTFLSCSENQLTSLDVSKNTALTSLSCGYNQLMSLDVSGCTGLTSLQCESNQLLNLDLSNNNSINDTYTSIGSQTRSLTAVDISAGIAIPVPSDFDFSKVSNLKLNGTAVSGSVTSVNGQMYLVFAPKGTAQGYIDGKKLTYTYSTGNSFSQAASMDVTVALTYTPTLPTAYSLSIQSGSGGSVSYDGTTVTNTTRSFTVNEGTSATITITPNTGYKLSKLTVNGTDVTSSVKDNQYTISNISANTTIVATFEQITYTLSVQATGNGSVAYNGTSAKNNTRTFEVNHGTSATLTITPDAGYRLASLTVNGTNVTSSVSNNRYTISNITANTTVVATFEQIPVTTYSLSIQSGVGGSVFYDGTTITNKTQSFTIAEGSSVTIEMTPSNGYKLASLVVNGTDVTSGVRDNQYTISNITANTTVVVTFKAIPQTISVDGINYEVKSATDYTLNVGKGNYSGHVVIPATVSYDGDTWTVAGVVDGAFNLSVITAITWNPNTAIGDGAFGAQTNPNLLLYVKSEAYAPSNVQNVIVNGRARKIVLTDAASGNDFNCPEAFTAEEISYTHRYGMTTGIGECRGWEAIALPFTVQKVMHQTKGQLVTFKQWDQSTSAKPYWLYKLTYTGFAEADFIEANTPYVISMPNHEKYFVDYILAGNVTFSAENATVKTSENMTMPTCNDKTFRPCFAKTAQSGVYAINAVNSWVTNTGGYKEGSVFVEGLRPVLPFEAYMTTNAANAKGIIPLFETQPTAIREIPTQGEKGVRIYSMSGELIMFDQNISIEEALKHLKRGVYFVNGKKMVVK